MSLYATARALLDALDEAFAADGITLPPRRYVTPGLQPAYDDPQVTVTVVAVRSGIPGAERAVPDTGCGGPRFATYRVEVIRCTPRTSKPTAEALDASAQEILADVEALDRNLQQIARALAAPAAINVTNAVPIGPGGGLAGSACDVDLPLYPAPV